MNTTHRIASFALAGLLTFSVMLGIDHLATSDIAPAATMAAASAPRA